MLAASGWELPGVSGSSLPYYLRGQNIDVSSDGPRDASRGGPHGAGGASLGGTCGEPVVPRPRAPREAHQSQFRCGRLARDEYISSLWRLKEAD